MLTPASTSLPAGTFKRFLLSAALTLALAGLASAAENLRIERIDVVGKGLYRVETGERTPDAELPTGEVALPVKYTNIESTSTVPAQVGVEFGIEYRVVGEPDGDEVELEFLVIYPEAGLPDPESQTPLKRSSFKRMKPIGEVVYFGYGFENDWELVPGSWAFEIRHDGRKLAEESFTVVE